MILIETATEVCSVALAVDNKIISLRENRQGLTHSANAAKFVDEALAEAKLQMQDIDAVVVSSGPGSYTGLRIGVSLAKGLCYGADKKLIAINTLTSMAYGLDVKYIEAGNTLLCPMIDARRMEVYASIFGKDYSEIKTPEAVIIDENSFQPYLDKQKVVFFGDGAAKTTSTITHPNTIFVDDFKISATSLLQPAIEKFDRNEFEDVAYFEPFYLKEFQTSTPKKNILGL